VFNRGKPRSSTPPTPPCVPVHDGERAPHQVGVDRLLPGDGPGCSVRPTHDRGGGFLREAPRPPSYAADPRRDTRAAEQRGEPAIARKFRIESKAPRRCLTLTSSIKAEQPSAWPRVPAAPRRAARSSISRSRPGSGGARLAPRSTWQIIAPLRCRGQQSLAFRTAGRLTANADWLRTLRRRDWSRRRHAPSDR
jgi:hypothetical protein